MERPDRVDMQFCSLASSSGAGSAYVIRGAGTTVLVDCGVRLRRMEWSLRSVGVEPAEIAAVFLTHEHTDHCRGLQIKHPLHARHGIDTLYSAPPTWRELGLPDSPPYHPLSPHQTVRVGGLRIRAHPTSHDAARPLAFTFSTGGRRLGVVTDLGTIDPDLGAALAGADYYIFESNHDVRMEENSGRPAFLLNRILGPTGHLSNNQAGAALAELAGENTANVLLAHLSTECNTPQLAHTTCRRFLERAGRRCAVHVAPADRPSPWLGRAANTRREVGGGR